MRPALRSGLLPLWRDRDTIQIGVDPRRAIALTGAGAAAALIGLLDGSRDRAHLVAAAAELGIPAPVTERMLALLAAADVLIDFPAGMVQDLPAELRRQLLPELAAASLARLDADGGAQVLARRAAAVVQVRGTGRVAASIAEVLTASGVATSVRLQAAPAGRNGSGPPQPGLVVVAGRQPLEAADQLRREQVPHLAVSAAEAIGTVGPLVRPGVTACLRCLDLARADRDPAWPLILAQLASRQDDPAACDAALVAAVAAQAAAQALQFIDRPGDAGPAENATLELVQPGWQWRRRTWPPHPACTCRAVT
jgi:bacteriocin biosynthesis cyclodehydratase domain-containing protein